MKRFLIYCLLLVLLLGAFSSCASMEREDGVLSVICTTFSLYDWTREIVGEREGVEHDTRGYEAYAAFPGCPSESEASFETVLALDSLETVNDKQNESYLARMSKNLEVLATVLGVAK